MRMHRRLLTLSAVIVALAASVAVLSAQTTTVANWYGNILRFEAPVGSYVVDIDGTNRLVDVHALKINGTLVTATAAMLNEVGTSGVVALDGSNPTSVTMSPLTTIHGCSVTLQGSAAPGLDPYTFSIVTTAVAGRLDIYAWKATSSGNPTLIASTATNAVQYDCHGV